MEKMLKLILENMIADKMIVDFDMVDTAVVDEIAVVVDTVDNIEVVVDNMELNKLQQILQELFLSTMNSFL